MPVRVNPWATDQWFGYKGRTASLEHTTHKRSCRGNRSGRGLQRVAWSCRWLADRWRTGLPEPRTGVGSHPRPVRTGTSPAARGSDPWRPCCRSSSRHRTEGRRRPTLWSLSRSPCTPSHVPLDHEDQDDAHQQDEEEAHAGTGLSSTKSTWDLSAANSSGSVSPEAKTLATV